MLIPGSNIKPQIKQTFQLVESVRLQYGIPDQYLEELLDCIRKAFTSSDYASYHSNQVTTEMVSMTTDDLGEMLTVKGDS